MQKTISLSLLAIVALLFSQISVAQNFSVSPPVLKFDTEPGKSSTLQVTITNTANSKKAFNLSLGDWMQTPNGEVKYLPSGQTAKSSTKFIKITPQLVELNPHETKKVDVNITIPSSVTDTRWAMLHVKPSQEQQRTVAADKTLRAGTFSSAQVALPILQSPKSNTNYKVKFSDLKEANQSDNQRVFAASINNQGGKVIDGIIHTTIANIETGEESKLDPQNILVLPTVNRIVQFKLPSDLKPGQYLLSRVLDYDDNADLEGVQLQIEVN